MRKKELRQKQDELRRANQAYKELAFVGGYMDEAEKLISLMYVNISATISINERLMNTLERANLKTTKTISIHNKMLKATESYFKLFDGAMSRDSVMHWANDLDRLEKELYKFANIKTLRPKRKAMKEAKPKIEKRYNIELEDLK